MGKCLSFFCFQKFPLFGHISSFSLDGEFMLLVVLLFLQLLQWFVGVAVQIFHDSQGKLCSEMPFSNLLWTCIWKWSGEIIWTSSVCWNSFCIYSLICNHHLGSVSDLAWRRGEGFYKKPGVQVLYAQVSWSSIILFIYL